MKIVEEKNPEPATISEVTPIQPAPKLIITNEGIAWSDFKNVLEVLGFIDIFCQPLALKKQALALVEKMSQG